jgi:DNA-binding transcriptional LysR family regulator
VAVELRHLRYFVAVVEAGQISAAARRLHLAQPALSQAMQALEREVGVPLLERHPRGVRPTPAGEAFVRRARMTLDNAQDAVRAARQLGASPEFLVGALPSLPEVAADVIERFRVAHPELSVRWKPLDFPSELSSLLDGSVDVAFLWAPYRTDRIVMEPIHEEPPMALMAASHPLAKEESLTFEQLDGETFPAPHPEIPSEWADYYYLTDVRGHRPPVSTEITRTVDEVVALIASGKAISVSPAFLVRIIARAGLVGVPVVDVRPFVMSLAWRADDTRDLVREFVDSVMRTRGLGDGGAPDE